MVSIEHPSVTIIMPIRNEADFIERSLTAVLTQDYPHNKMTILIADGMSTDDTRPIISDISAQCSHIPLVILDNPAEIVPTGMNIALSHAEGDIIIRVDGHCIIAPDYVSRCVEHLLNDGVDGVGGSITTIAETVMGKAIALAMSSPFGVGGSAFRTRRNETLVVDSVPFPAYTRAAVELAGPYDEELKRNQDDEYNYRLRKLGAKILLAADVKSTYYSRSTYRSLWQQYTQYGFYKVRVLQKHPRQMRLRQFVPPLFVFCLLILGGLSFLFPQPRIALALVTVAYVLANLIASIITSRNTGWKSFWRLPLAFVILHVGYGLGFLLGLVRFSNRWR